MSPVSSGTPPHEQKSWGACEIEGVVTGMPQAPVVFSLYTFAERVIRTKECFTA